MQLKIFSGTPEALEGAVTNWMQEQRSRISHVLQSQSTAADGSIRLTITLFYEEPNMGTGLGFNIRRNS